VKEMVESDLHQAEKELLMHNHGYSSAQ